MIWSGQEGGVLMSSVPSTNFRELAVEFPDRKELIKNFLGETPFGGLAVNVEDPLEVGEVVQLHVLCYVSRNHD